MTCLHAMRPLLIFTLCVSPLIAQVSANLSGTITDQTGSVVTGAAITVTNMDTGAVRRGDTDNAGRYQVPGLPPGQYEIHALKSGFAEAVRSGVNLAVGQ